MNNRHISIIGQGYVGLPLAISLLKLGYKVFGIDLDEEKVVSLNKGFSSVEDVSDQDVLTGIKNGSYEATSDFSKVALSEIVIVCVPTPLNLEHEPDLSHLTLALSSISLHLRKGTLIILESTVAPGTTRGLVAKIIENKSGRSINDFYLVFSPERIDPRNQKWNVSNTPKLVAGLNPQSCDKGIEFYSKFISTVVRCESLEVAETAKLLENSFRLINISFINEFSVFCEKIGIEVNSVINAAATKPYGFMPFYPSIGVGGHCIPVDPLYLSSKAREIGAPTKFIDLASQVNMQRPLVFVQKAELLLGELNGKRILVVGVAYKPNVSDVRETPVKELIIGLKNRGAKVFWHDEIVKVWEDNRSADLVGEYDLAIIATRHDYLDLSPLEGLPVINASGFVS
jgi:UDP-N-acetyl-D-glucosamine dehydrogenase